MINDLIDKIKTENIDIPEYLTNMTNPEFVQLAQKGFSDPEKVQKLLLEQIINRSSGTEFGKKNNFQNINSVDDFQKKIPVSEWADYENYSDRMADGETDLLFPGLAKYFILTSGTSSPKPKMIPESKMGAMAKQIVSRFRLLHMALNIPGIQTKGYIFPLSNVLPPSVTKAGIPVGFASGLTLDQSLNDGKITRMAYPAAVLTNDDSESRDYLIMRFALQIRDVMIVVGNNAGRFKKLVEFGALHADEIINDIENGTVRGAAIVNQEVMDKITPLLIPDKERADELRAIKNQTGTIMPKECWPLLKYGSFWLSATVGDYVKDVRAILPPDSKFFDVGYGASEGKFNIPSIPDQAAGTLSIYTSFFEFIPEEGGKTLLAHQLENGKSYEMVVTTWSGLYRYNMKDMIRVDGFTDQTPNIVFLHKSGEILNISDEKVPASLVNETIRDVASGRGIDIVQVQVFPSQNERRYICYVEQKGESLLSEIALLETEINALLSSRNIPYDFVCNKQHLISTLKIVEMKHGWQDHLYALRTTRAGVSSAQIKLPVQIKEEVEEEWIRK